MYLVVQANKKYISPEGLGRMVKMLINHNGIVYHDNKYSYRNDNEFQYKGINYERDMESGRCYQLDYSSCLRSNCDGKLVKRRIKKADYENILTKLKQIIVSE